VGWRRGPRRSRAQHEAAAHDRQATPTTGALSRTQARTENPHRDLMRHGAISPALAPRHNNAAATQNPSQRDYRLSLRPGRARRLSKAGRHWAPIARQRATREERHSGGTWPTYYKKPNWAPPGIDGSVRTVAAPPAAVKPKTFSRADVFLDGLYRPLVVSAPQFKCLTSAEGSPCRPIRRHKRSRHIRPIRPLPGTASGITGLTRHRSAPIGGGITWGVANGVHGDSVMSMWLR
jgi:hypothetical protein